ncbi:hypothetical protein BH23PAT2_BH23PAT2_07750 [soil metagenome]
MAQTEDEKQQTDLFGELEKNDVTVPKDAAEVMKENILNDKGGANYLGIGVHDVVVISVELVQAKTGTMGIKFNVENGDGKSDVSMWLSEGALPYTIENVSRLMVHNAAEDKKDAARNMMSNIVSAKELFNILKETIKVREEKKLPFACYLSIREDQSGRTYKDKNGDEKPSLDRNLLSYKPKQTAVQSVVQATGGTLLDANGAELPF